jgi:hypothetical protein
MRICFPNFQNFLSSSELYSEFQTKNFILEELQTECRQHEFANGTMQKDGMIFDYFGVKMCAFD